VRYELNLYIFTSEMCPLIPIQGCPKCTYCATVRTAVPQHVQAGTVVTCHSTDPRDTKQHQLHLQYYGRQLQISPLSFRPFIACIFALKTFPYLVVMDEDEWRRGGGGGWGGLGYCPLTMFTLKRKGGVGGGNRVQHFISVNPSSHRLKVM